MIKSLRLSASLLVLVGWPISASSGTIVDQVYEPVSPHVYAGIGAADFAQTFTFGQSGQLTAIELKVNASTFQTDAELLFDIRPIGNEGGPLEDDSTAIVARAIPRNLVSSDEDSYVFIDLSNEQLRFDAGDQLAVVLRARPDGVNWNAASYWWMGTSWRGPESNDEDPYVGGAAYLRAPWRNDLVPPRPLWSIETHSFSDGTTAQGMDLGFRVFVDASVRLSVVVDIKPRNGANCFNQDGHGVIPVAVVGSEEFDVSLIDQGTLAFGGLAVRVRGNNDPMCSLADVNEDGIWDLVCHFEDDSDLWAPGQGEATLEGLLLDGTEFEGSDSICIVPE